MSSESQMQDISTRLPVIPPEATHVLRHLNPQTTLMPVK